MNDFAMTLISDQNNTKSWTYHKSSLDEFFEERRLSNFHFLLPFLSGLGLSSSHLSNEPMVAGGNNAMIRMINDQNKTS